MKIDAHQHFWHFDPVRDSWIDDSMKVLRQDFLPENLELHLNDAGMEGCIAVQADQSEGETQFLLNLADKNSIVKGVVGWVDLCADDVKERLAHFSENALFKGVRHIVQAEPDPDFMQRSDFQSGISALSDFDLTYDILVYPNQLPSAIRLVSQFPDQPFVLDHIAKPLIKDHVFEPWKTQIQELARHPNVYCKLSGAITEADWQSWDKTEITPYFDIACEAFGSNRLMFGSDWPVCNLAGSYERVYVLMNQYLSQFSPEEQEKIWGKNAIDFYKIESSR